ncbi:MAG: hypothetical protein ABF649_21930 [Bacillus sp. (in: firmicutes)]
MVLDLRLQKRLTMLYTPSKGSKVVYIGRTKNIAARKSAAHKKVHKDASFRLEKRSLRYAQARGLEHRVYLKNGGKKNLRNNIRPISKKIKNTNTNTICLFQEVFIDKEEKMDKEAIIKQLKLNINSTNNLQKISVIQDILIELFNYDVRLLDGIVSEVKIKQQKKTKYFKQIKMGQIFEIFLEDVQKYNYGVVISGDLVLNKNDDVIIAYIDVFSEIPLEVCEIFSYIRKHKFLMIANTGYASIMNYDWKLTSQYTEVILSDKELQNIEYVASMEGKYYKSIGISDREIFDCEIIEEKEAKKIANPLGIVGDLEIKRILRDKYYLWSQ